MNEARIISLSQKAFGLCIFCVGIQQLGYGDIAPNFLPPAFSGNAVYKVLTYPWGIAFTLSGVAYFLNKRALDIALISGAIFLGCFLFAYVPFILFDENDNPFQWAPAISTLAFTGSTLVLAASFLNESADKRSWIPGLEKLAPWGGPIFGLHLIGYGGYHFVYNAMIATMVPSWIPFHEFWTYATGVALIGAGLAVAFNIKRRLVGILLAIMLFTWCIILHVPRAIAHPLAIRGLELTRVFVSFGFTGTALLIAYAGTRRERSQAESNT